MGFWDRLTGGGAGELEYTSWALDQIKSRTVSPEMVQPKIQALVDALGALRGQAAGQVFGLEAGRIEPQGRRKVEAGIIAALTEWKRHFQEQKDSASLLVLDGVGKVHGLADLRLSGRFPLRCDPLGTRDGLSAEWLARLHRLDEVRAGKRKLDLVAIHVVGAERVYASAISLGRPDEKTLYERVLRSEAESDAAFPRELAAWCATADGISVDGDPVLRPISAWEWDFDDRGLCIGCGGYMQGSLILEEPSEANGLLSVEVVDVDDDGEERARYSNFAAFVDAMLGV